MITLETLVTALGADLRPITPGSLRQVVTGVHMSELPDPTPFLAGGELLLTTGMHLVGTRVPVEAYVARLVDREVAGLGFGLGPVYEAVPPALMRACASAEFPLFLVPEETPFLVLSREFWRQLSRQDTEHLSAALGAHHALVRAAAGGSAATDIIRVLARGVGGWAASVAVDGTVDTVWPASAVGSAEQAAAEVHHLYAAGPSSATFPVGDLDVVLHPIARHGHPVAYLATASARPFAPSLRGLALTAAALLELHHGEDVGRAHADRVARSGLAWLLLRGHVVAARSLSRDLGVDLPPCVRMVVAALVDRTRTPLTVDAATLAAHLPEAVAACVYAPGRLLAIVAADAFTEPATDPRWRVVASSLLRPDDVAAALPALQARVDRLPGGAFEITPELHDPGPDHEALARLLAYRRADLTGAVVAYLRHQGRLEPAAQELGVHRNTLRHRLDVAAQQTGLDLTDPDTAARWWLLLRSRGLA